MVVDYAYGLQMAVDDYGANILEAALLQVLGYAVGEVVAGYPSMLMGRIDE